MYYLSSRSIFILYIDSSTNLRYCACSWPTYFTLESSATKVKLIGLVLWCHILDVMGAGK